MKSKIYLISLYVGCCVAYGGDRYIQEYGNIKGVNGIPLLDDSYLDYWKKSENAYENQKNMPLDIYEPCHKRNNDECIRHFLSSTGQCSPVYRPEDKEIIYREQGVFYLPKVNFTFIQQHSKIEGLNNKIVEEFYINKKTHRLVYAINFKQINIASQNAFYIFHRRGKEPIIVQDEVQIQYAPTILTAVIPLNEQGLSLKEAMITAYLTALPAYTVGPKVSSNPDPTIQSTLAAIASNVDTTTPEALLTEAPNFFLTYLQNFICDYGIRV